MFLQAGCVPGPGCVARHISACKMSAVVQKSVLWCLLPCLSPGLAASKFHISCSLAPAGFREGWIRCTSPRVGRGKEGQKVWWKVGIPAANLAASTWWWVCAARKGVRGVHPCLRCPIFRQCYGVIWELSHPCLRLWGDPELWLPLKSAGSGGSLSHGGFKPRQYFQRSSGR